MSKRLPELPSSPFPTVMAEKFRPSEPSGETGKFSPMMAQYAGIKAQHRDALLFYRMGDFYELFFEDAEIAAHALGIVLTKRGKQEGQDIPMCGVPIERAEDYLHRLIGQGHRVAICEQIEDPAEAKKRGGKSVVRREVVRLVTPGTLTEEPLLDPASANSFAAIASAETPLEFGVALVDISTGAFRVESVTADGLEAALARLDPAELVLSEDLMRDPAVARLTREPPFALTPLAEGLTKGTSAERRLKTFFGLSVLDGLGQLSGAEIGAAATAILYVERTQMAARPSLGLPMRQAQGMRMEIDAATRASLELAKTLAGQREGTLLAAIDQTITAPGSRLLAERLAAPLTDPEAICQRLDAIEFFAGADHLRMQIRTALKAVPDVCRALSRLSLDRGGPRDLGLLCEGLAAAAAVAEGLGQAGPLPQAIAEAQAAVTKLDQAIEAKLRDALAPSLPLNRRDGGFIREQYDVGLDAARALRDESRSIIAALQARYGELTGIKPLKVKHNHFLGFFIEVPQAPGERLLKPPHDGFFIHRQTMAGAMRFSTRELAELEAKIASAAGDALAREEAIFAELAGLVLTYQAEIRGMAQALAAIDVAAGLAELARRLNWSRPQVDRSLAFVIEEGRHPVVEAALRREGQAFAGNACDLSGKPGKGGRIAVVTGPNMAGKSTFLRQNALIAILAQMGAFVPAKRASIGIIDKLYSRVGAADDLARGRSTFMVEMIETAAILNQAGERSLVILDEIGRGTATFDGLAIAWAVIEHLHEKNRSRALFATHFHELTRLSEKLGRLDNLTVRVTDWNGEVVFLHEIVPGAADRSYGIQVAKLAGLPPPVLARARELLREFEAADRRTRLDQSLAELPLFSVPALVEAAVAPKDLLGDALDAIHPDELTPRAALEALYKLKALRTQLR